MPAPAGRRPGGAKAQRRGINSLQGLDLNQRSPPHEGGEDARTPLPCGEWFELQLPAEARGRLKRLSRNGW
jgi:hypothetical protein